MTMPAQELPTTPQNKQEFETALDDMQKRFESMEPELAVTLTDPDMGVEGFIVVWNTGISRGGPLDNTGKGCGKGGTRITPDVVIEEVAMLARSAGLKNAAAGLAMGGAKSGLKADPDSAGFEQKYRRFAQLAKEHLRENGGIWGGFGFDIGARPAHPRWICEELQSTTCFTGKPLDMGGTDYDREGIAGLGVAVAGKTLMECHGAPVKGATFAVQGLGAMGAAVLRYFTEYGGKLAALADPKYGGTWTFENGISDELYDALVMQDIGTAEKLIEKEGAHISDDAQDVLYQDVDILFPCAVQYVIRGENAGKIKARFISEGANNPTTSDGYDALVKQGIHFVPDFIANPGGVIAAFVELTSSVTPEENAKTHAKVKEAKDTTIERITANVKELCGLVKDFEAPPQRAGLYMALSKILVD